MSRILTGVQASGDLHWGNYFGAIKPMFAEIDENKNEIFLFIADLHAFTSTPDPDLFRENSRKIILDFLSLGVDTDKCIFYRQSDVPAHTELMWFLLCQTPMGILERAHSYKDKVSNNILANAGLFTYPILMAADILLYEAEIVPVGKDQKQHVEIARDIAQKFNNKYGETFVLPKPQIDKNIETIQGLDGKKMSKSYGNTIEIFAEEKVLQKKINQIKTESLPLGSPIDFENCPVFNFHKLFQNPNLKSLEKKYKNGEIGFGESKKQLFELVMDYWGRARKIREKLQNDQKYLDEIMEKGAKKAIGISNRKIKIVREKMGF